MGSSSIIYTRGIDPGSLFCAYLVTCLALYVLASFLQRRYSRSITLRGGGIASGMFLIEKWDSDEDYRAGRKPREIIRKKNAYINAGAQDLLDLLTGAGGTAFSSANAYIGVGDSTTAVVATQTDLQASSNKLRKGMDSTYPSRSGQVVTWHATFGSSDANFQWNEAGLFNGGPTGGKMLSRIVQNLGTKSGGTWAITYQITLP